MQLLDPDLGNDIFRALELIKKKGLTKKIGISIYDPILLNKIINKYKTIDIVQAPLNIFDQRIIRTGWLKRLASDYIEVHVRSIFLQGLLLMEPNSRPSYFGEWAHLFGIWDRLIDRLGVSRTAVCIGFINQHTDISQAIVGIDNINQLEQILDATRQPVVFDIEGICSDDSGLINPSNWKI